MKEAEYKRDIVHTNATVGAKGEPMVFWHLNGNQGAITVTEARERAFLLLSAAAHSAVEGKVAYRLSGLEKLNKAKGFGFQGEKLDAQRKCAELLDQIRSMQDFSSPDVKTVFGYSTNVPLVDVDWYGEKAQWEVNTAIEHALILLETAEASQYDALLRAFLVQDIELGNSDVDKIFSRFRLYRQRQALEDKF